MVREKQKNMESKDKARTKRIKYISKMIFVKVKNKKHDGIPPLLSSCSLV